MYSEVSSIGAGFAVSSFTAVGGNEGGPAGA